MTVTKRVLLTPILRSFSQGIDFNAFLRGFIFGVWGLFSSKLANDCIMT